VPRSPVEGKRKGRQDAAGERVERFRSSAHPFAGNRRTLGMFPQPEK
jgi:hypothetical protein